MTISPNTARAAAEAIRRGHQAGGPGHDEDDACQELARRVEAEGQVPDQLSPLDMAANLAAKVQQYAEALSDPDPDRRIQAQIAQAGERAHTGAQLAANLALVSIAQDLHWAVQLLLTQTEGWAKGRDDAWAGAGPVPGAGSLNDPDSPISRWARGEPPWHFTQDRDGAIIPAAPEQPQEGAVDDARRTREHMRAWGQGEQDHPGEEGQ